MFTLGPTTQATLVWIEIKILKIYKSSEINKNVNERSS
jgi:hypothetical protein